MTEWASLEAWIEQHATLIISVLIFEFVLHWAVLIAVSVKLIDALEWLWHRLRPAHSGAIPVEYPCGCRSIIQPLPSRELEVLCSDDHITFGFIHTSRIARESFCQEHQVE